MHPKLKTFLAAFGVFTGIILVIIYFWAIPELKKTIEGKIQSTLTPPHHKISYENLEISLYQGKIRLITPHLKPDTADKDLFRLTLKASSLSVNVRIFSLLRETITLKSLTLQNPESEIFLPSYDTSVQTNDFQKQRDVRFEKIVINNGRIHFKQINALNDTIILSSNEINFTTTNLNTGAKTASLFQQISASQNTVLNLQDLAYNKTNSDYRLALKQFHYSAKKQKLTGQHFKVTPKSGANAYFRKYGYQKDYLNVQIDSFAFHNIREMSLSSSGQNFKTGKMNLFTPRLTAFRDRNYPPPDVNKALPWLSFQTLPYKFTIDTMAVKKAYIRYREKPKNGSKSGKVIFAPTYFSAFNFTNDSATIKQNPEMTFACKSKLMQKGPLKISGTLQLNNESGKHHVKGKLGNFKLVDINPVIEPLSVFSAKSGTNNALHFNMNANQKNAKGELRFRYKNINIAVEKEDSNAKRVIPSVLLNTFAVKSHNPAPGNSLRVAQLNYKRDPHKSVFNFWWKTALQGIFKSAGVEKLAERLRS